MNIKVTEIDVKMYNLLYDAVLKAPYTLGKVVPTFIINEAIYFFQCREEYEKCHVLKTFFDQHPERRVSFSRRDYMDYGWEMMA